MRWASYRSQVDGRERAAVVLDQTLHAVDATLVELLGDGGDRLRAAAEEARVAPVEVVPLSQAQLLAPIPAPPSVRDFMAFEEHVVNALGSVGVTVDPIWYDLPVFYFSNPAAVIGPHDDVPIAPGSRAFDFELEVAAIVGLPGRDLDPATAERHIAGYTVLCDWSARDLQLAETKVGLGPVKGKDTATSLGPFLVTPDELAPRRKGSGFALRMTASVNGRPHSEGLWSDIHWSFGQMLAYASRGTTLRAGDVIGSGTVGTGCLIELSRLHGTAAYPWLQAGDRVRLEVELLGAIEATVVTGADPIPLT